MHPGPVALGGSATITVPNYYVWTKHGERGIMLDNNEEEEDRIPDFAANYGAFFMTLQWVRLRKMLKDTL